MKFNIFKLFMLATALLLTFTGCSDDDTFDNRDLGYGYVQFKLYKEASYNPSESRAVNSSLDNLSDAHKIRVEFLQAGTRFSQTMVLNSYNAENAAYGLRSEKLKLVIGDYTILGYTLYDALDQELYLTELSTQVSIIEGGLVTKDLTVNARQKGKVNFTFVKDIDESVITKSIDNEFMFTDIKYISLNVKQNSEIVAISNLPVAYQYSFDKDDNNRQTGVLITDTVVNLAGGDWTIVSYSLATKDKTIVATATISPNPVFTITDNALSKVDVPVKIDTNQEYIKDYLALYEIWKALNGPNWSFQGEGFNKGCNWDFNKDLDLWGRQPGVSLHSNGRVGLLNISGFGFEGHMPAALGQLTELAELYLGTHNDINEDVFEPSESIEGMALNGTLENNRIEIGKKYLAKKHKTIAEQTLSPVLQSAYHLKGISIPGGIEFDKDGFADFNQNIAPRNKSTRKSPISRADTGYGKLCNGLKSLPKEIGNLKRLQTLFIANSTIEELPEELSLLEELTDVEIYNCPRMSKFPMSITRIPRLTALNIANNTQWDSEDVYNGIDALGNNICKDYLQLLYCNYSQLKQLPLSLGNIKRIGLMDFSYNQLEGVLPVYGDNINPVQIMFDGNQITRIPRNFCGYNDIESFSANNNKLTKFPNIFSHKGLQIKGVSFADNQIDGFDGEGESGDDAFQGLNVVSLNLSGNKFTKYPSLLWTSGSSIGQINLAVNQISEFPDDSFTGPNVFTIESIDLTSNLITKLPHDLNGKNAPFLYGMDLSCNQLSAFPWDMMSISGLTVLILRTQRDANGNRCYSEFPKNVGNHIGLRGLYLGSNDLGVVNEQLSNMIFHMDISDNPNITFYAGSICYYIRNNMYNLYYDRSQDIRDCSALVLDK